jgi:DNA repair exonuclease SbcCD ATPase subunit
LRRDNNKPWRFNLKSLILALVLVAVSCGPRKKVVTHIENPYDNSTNDSRLGNLEQRVNTLELQINNVINNLSTIDGKVDALETQLPQEIATLNSEILSLQSQIGAIPDNSGELTQLQSDLSSLQSQLNSTLSAGQGAYNSIIAQINTLNAQSSTLNTTVSGLVSQLATLQSNNNVVAIFDPCPSVNATYKEMLFQMSDGTYVAYFENGGERFLTVVPSGNYQTTDSRHCNFSI